MKNNLTEAIKNRIKQVECSIQNELQEQHEMRTFNQYLTKLRTHKKSSKLISYEMY